MTAQNKSAEEMKNSPFHELFVHELKDIYWAETHLAKALPKLSKAASSPNLTKAIEEHTEETENHVKRLEQVFDMLGHEASGITCEAMQGLLEEADEILDTTDTDSMVSDAGIIISCQKVEHYEIASYGSLTHLAKTMGHNQSAELFEQTLDEEKNADALLTKIAEEEVNQEAKKV